MTTTSSTSTFSTASLCYVMSAAATPLLTCKRRKRSSRKRSFDISEIAGDEEVMPSSVSSALPREEDGLADEDIEGGMRNGKFVNYWITTTVTSTTTGSNNKQTSQTVIHK